MRLTKTEKTLLEFLQKHPNQWHTYGRDAKTRRAVAGLYLYRGLGVRGFVLSRETSQMKLEVA